MSLLTPTPITARSITPAQRAHAGIRNEKPLSSPAVRFGSGQSAPGQLNAWETMKALYKQLHLEDETSQQIFKGLAMKHGPDLLLPAFFSIPVVGWIAGIVALPFMGWIEHRGGKIIEKHSPALKNDKSKPIYHYLKLERLWEQSARDQAKAPKDPATQKDTASRMARSWNRLIDTLFTHEEADLTPALKRRLRIPLDEHKNPQTAHFEKFQRLIHAREGLHQKWYYKVFLAPVDWFYQKFPLPKILKAVALLPKLGVLALFYALRIKPRV